MVDLLSKCLTACNRLDYEIIKIDFRLLDEFRGVVYRLVCKREDEIENSIQRRLRLQLWRFVIDLSNAPLQWERSIDELFDLSGKSFVELIRDQFGQDSALLAANLANSWTNRLCSHFTSPMYAELLTVLTQLRNSQTDFRILATNRQRKLYEPLLVELELFTNEVFCSIATLKSVPPFECLVTCGPFREDIDTIFTAPRYQKIINIRWSKDDDIPGFPNYMTLDDYPANKGELFPEDFPVRVLTKESIKKIVAVEHSIDSLELRPTQNWSFDDFELLFVRRSRTRRVSDRRMGIRTADRTQAPHSYSTVRLHFVDGSYWTLPFDQQSKPPLVYSIDRDSDSKPVKRRAVLECELPTSRDLLPGMLVVVEPPVSADLRELAVVDHPVNRSHLIAWKEKLRVAVQQLGNNSLHFRFQSLGYKIENIESKIERWLSVSSGIDAPQDFETFAFVVGTFAGYNEVELAWQEILTLRGSRIQDGRYRENAIDQYLLSSVESSFQLLIDESRTEIAVEGFVEPAVVIELSHVEFSPEGQLSQVGRYRRVDDPE